MSERDEGLKQLIEDIFATDANEIQCDQADTQMARSVADGLTEAQSQRQHPYLWQHFKFCVDCKADYDLLLEMARLETAGQFVPPSHLPPRPDKQSIGGWQELIAGISGQVSHLITPALSPTRSNDALETAMTAPLGPWQVDLDVEASETEANYFDLLCTVSLAESLAESLDEPLDDENEVETEIDLEGSTIWLAEAESGAVLQEDVLDELGDASFFQLKAGQYALRLHIRDTAYVVTGIQIPVS